MKKWIYVGHVRSHTHDIRALTVAVPICREGIYFSYWSLSQRKFFSLSSFLLMSFFFSKPKFDIFIRVNSRFVGKT